MTTKMTSHEDMLRILSDAINYESIIERVHAAARLGLVIMTALGVHLEDCYSQPALQDVLEHLVGLVAEAGNDFWLELERAAPGMLPEDVEGYATDGRLFDVFIHGLSANGLKLSVDILMRLV